MDLRDELGAMNRLPKEIALKDPNRSLTTEFD